jgi:inner membrane protein
MDPLAHTLVGATLAEAGLRRKTKLATAALILGANAPDIDIVAGFFGTDATFAFRRGHTHGVVAMAVLPLAVAAALLFWDRYVRRRLRPGDEPARAGPLVAVSALAVLTHPVLDWLNTYGVRVLMPFDGTWFYGDALFIVDPWLWLLAAASVVLARSSGPLAASGFVVLGCAATALVMLSGVAPEPARWAWAAGLLAIVALRLLPWSQARVPRIAAVCLCGLGLYIVAMVAGSQIARGQVVAWLLGQGLEVDASAAGPMPADPLRRLVIARAGGAYYYVERAFLEEPGFGFVGAPLPVGPRDAVVEVALSAPSIRGRRAWMRFPVVRVETASDGYVVTLFDARFARGPGSGLGTAVVRLDRALRVR